MERDHDRAAKLAHEVEDVVTVAAAPDAVLVLDRDHVDSAVVESARNEDVVRQHVAADPVAYFGWIRTRLVDGVKRHDLAVAHGTRQIVGESGDAAPARRIGGDERGSQNGTTPLRLGRAYRGNSPDAEYCQRSRGGTGFARTGGGLMAAFYAALTDFAGGC
jgi:hypothetical protein